MVFIDYLLRPENAMKNIDYLYYPFPVRDALPTFADLTKDAPACNVEISDLENATSSACCSPTRSSAVRPMWTEVKAS